jgi:hypothetical protein
VRRVEPDQVALVQQAGGDERGASTRRRRQRPAGPVERLEIAHATAAVLEVGFEHLRDRARAHLAQFGGRGQRSDDPVAALPCQLAHLVREFVDEGDVAGDHPHLEQRGERVEVVIGDRERFLHRAHGLTEHEGRVPQRVPEFAGGRRNGGPPTAAVQEHHVDVGTGAQLATRVGAESDDGPALVGQ